MYRSLAKHYKQCTKLINSIDTTTTTVVHHARNMSSVYDVFPVKTEFPSRHIGPRKTDVVAMLDSLGLKVGDRTICLYSNRLRVLTSLSSHSTSCPTKRCPTKSNSIGCSTSRSPSVSTANFTMSLFCSKTNCQCSGVA
jgi:hypothetical protein